MAAEEEEEGGGVVMEKTPPLTRWGSKDVAIANELHLEVKCHFLGQLAPWDD